ncbi:K(+)-transporting ATPase subunit F [Burkholderia cepacia]|uniref:K(+)-transporting ATPase subunit F n=1 Tax=Burkholderia cepacia TaxID=292 RepID=UPI0009C00ECF
MPRRPAFVFTAFLFPVKKLNTALIRGFLHCRIPFARRAWGRHTGLRRQGRARHADDRAVSPRIRKKGKAMLWITGALSLALFIYLFHALIKPERY